MPSREIRRQRRAEDRKRKKLERKQSQPSAAATPTIPHLSVLTHPDGRDLEEFPPELIAEANAMRARVYARIERARSAGASMPEPALPPPGRATGPRTVEGKAASSRNAFKHGLASGQIIVPGENLAEFEALLDQLRCEHRPANLTEDLLVRQIAQSWWLAQRALRLQNACFGPDEVDTKNLALFLRYQTTHERAFHKALATLLQMRKERRRNSGHFVSQEATPPDQRPGFVSQNSEDPAHGPVSSAPERNLESQSEGELTNRGFKFRDAA